MSKFKVGQKVLVTGSTYHPMPWTEEMIGKVCELKQQTSFGWGVFTPDKSDYWFFNESDIQPITEPAKEITLNGVTYVLKEDRKPEHEWKFGDWARHPKYGVVFVVTISQEFPKEIWVNPKEQIAGVGCLTAERVNASELTYISSATIPE